MEEHSKLKKYIGNMIRANRLKLGVRQNAFAKKLKMTRASIANIEAGRQLLPITKIFDLAKALNVSVSDIIPVNNEHLDMDYLGVVNELTELGITEEKKSEILKIIKSK